jgi:DNA polymerase-1
VAIPVRTLLIDTDIVAYKAAARAEESTAFGVVVGDLQEACNMAEGVIEEYRELLEADEIIVCLTDTWNFRLDVDPTYKANRSGTVRPQLLKPIKDYLAETYRSYIRPSLEADDVMGILATHPTLIPGDKIIVSEDKDMRTIPAKVYHPHRPELGVMEVSRLDADRFLMWQTICGDATDGYPGARGVGKSSEYAKDIIFADREDLWNEVLGAFASVGLTEEDALRQARLARILRAEDYNLKERRVNLWTPLMLL